MKRIVSILVILTMSLCGCAGINNSNSDTGLTSLIDVEETDVVHNDIAAPVENKRTEKNEAIEQSVKLFYTIGNTHVDVTELESVQGIVSQDLLNEMQARIDTFNAGGKTNRSIKGEQLISLIGDLHTGGLENPKNVPISPPDPYEMTLEQAQEYLKEQNRLVAEAQKKYDSTESIIKEDSYTLYLEEGGAYVYLDDGTKSPYIEDYSFNSFVTDYRGYELTLEASYYTTELIIFECIDTYMNKSIVRVEIDTQGKITRITDKWLEAKEPSEAELIKFKKSFEALHSESMEKDYAVARDSIAEKFNSNLSEELFGEYNSNIGYTTKINRISKGKKDGLLYVEMIVNYEDSKAKYSIVLEDTDRSSTYDTYTALKLEKEV